MSWGLLFTCSIANILFVPTCGQGVPLVQPFHFPEKVVVGQSVATICAVTEGSAPFTFRWLRNGNEVVEKTLAKIQTSEEISTLSLKSVSHEFSGNYTCVVSNTLGTGNFTSRLIVLENPEWLVTPKNTHILLGKIGRVDCSAKGVPHPRISWRKLIGDVAMDLFNSSHHQIAPNGSLLINLVNEKDEGDYECSAFNGIGHRLKKIINIQVKVAPQFYGDNNHYLLKIRSGEAIFLKCDVSGDIPITTKWSKEFLFDKRDKRYSIHETPLPFGVISELRISQARREDAGLFICSARNAFGQNNLTIKLVILEPPSSPSDILVTNISGREAAVTWSEPYSGNSDILEYIVQYWRDSGLSPKLQEITVEGEVTSYVLRSLKPGASYVVRLIAENEFGASTPSVPVKFKTEEQIPSGAPIDITVSDVGAHSLRVRWKAPPPEDANGEIQGFELGYRNKKITNNYSYMKVPYFEKTFQEFMLNELGENTEYEISLRAFNKAGGGPASVPVPVKTLRSGQLTTPVLWVESTYPSSILLRWSTKDTSHEGYSLHYRQEWGNWKENVIPNSDSKSYLLTDLEQNTVYQVYIQSIRGGNRSNTSSTLTVKTSASRSLMRTAESEISEAPHNLAIVVSLSVVCSSVIIVCVIAGACVYIARERSRSGQKIEATDLAESSSRTGSVPPPLMRNYQRSDVNLRPLLWCSTPTSSKKYPSPYATLPLRYSANLECWSTESVSPGVSLIEKTEMAEERASSDDEPF